MPGTPRHDLRRRPAEPRRRRTLRGRGCSDESWARLLRQVRVAGRWSVADAELRANVLRALVDGHARHSELLGGFALAESVDEQHDRQRALRIVEAFERLDDRATCLRIHSWCDAHGIE